MVKKFKETIYQEFERFMRDGMEDNEKKVILIIEDTKLWLKKYLKILIDKSLEKKNPKITGFVRIFLVLLKAEYWFKYKKNCIKKI